MAGRTILPSSWTIPISGSETRSRRPVDAASLIILDGAPDQPRVLMGRRSARHTFMPSVYVFPGGKVDLTDNKHSRPLVPPDDHARLLRGLGARGSDRRVRALAFAALRETEEETGLVLAPDASERPLRYVARAITPPGRVRRFDARFFACRRADLVQGDATPTDELEDLRWIKLGEADNVALARITTVILNELEERLRVDPNLVADRPIPHHRMRNRAFVRLLD